MQRLIATAKTQETVQVRTESSSPAEGPVGDAHRRTCRPRVLYGNSAWSAMSLFCSGGGSFGLAMLWNVGMLWRTARGYSKIAFREKSTFSWVVNIKAYTACSRFNAFEGTGKNSLCNSGLVLSGAAIFTPFWAQIYLKSHRMAKLQWNIMCVTTKTVRGHRIAINY